MSLAIYSHVQTDESPPKAASPLQAKNSPDILDSRILFQYHLIWATGGQPRKYLCYNRSSLEKKPRSLCKVVNMQGSKNKGVLPLFSGVGVVIMTISS